MAGIDEKKPFKPVNIAVLTISDTRSLEDDKSGDLLVGRLTEAGHSLADRAIVKDDVPQIRDVIRRWAGDPGIDVILTTGGTGLTGRDVTPEAVRPRPAYASTTTIGGETVWDGLHS
jgi:molybdenum cofactor biosynthesis protein B